MQIHWLEVFVMLNIRNLINNFTIKTPDGFPVAKALYIFY